MGAAEVVHRLYGRERCGALEVRERDGVLAERRGGASARSSGWLPRPRSASAA
jgi:hypothetical protein